MPDAPMERLCRVADLDPDDVAFLRRFDDEELTRLVEAVERAQRRRDQQLERAIDDGLTLVPKLLRRPVVKVLQGGGR